MIHVSFLSNSKFCLNQRPNMLKNWYFMQNSSNLGGFYQVFGQKKYDSHSRKIGPLFGKWAVCMSLTLSFLLHISVISFIYKHIMSVKSDHLSLKRVVDIHIFCQIPREFGLRKQLHSLFLSCRIAKTLFGVAMFQDLIKESMILSLL